MTTAVGRTRRSWPTGGSVPLVGLLGLTTLAAWALLDQARLPRPVHFAGMTWDRLSALLTLLVAGVGTVTYRFSIRYLDGEPGQSRFLGWLTWTVISAYLLMLATNFLLLFAAWSAMSFGLHRLLTHYSDRREAFRPAYKKFLISRLGDLALVAAIVTVWLTWGTLDLTALLPQMTAEAQTSPAHAVAILVVIAALTKSAQFPFHSWLPETMEAPTPVSALMHAGVINAGGALLLRFAPLVSRVPAAWLLLVSIGTLTACLGLVASWPQVKVKRTLAWSTVSQMGFMMLQCGLSAFPAAALHMFGHGCYKAWSFLRSGELPGAKPVGAAADPARGLSIAAFGTALALPCLALAAWVSGFHFWQTPGETALALIVALAVGQLWAAALGRRRLVSRQGALLATVVSPAVSLVAIATYQGISGFLSPVLGELPGPSGPLAWAAAGLPVCGFAGLTVIHAYLPTLGRSRAGRAFHVHALHGFYLGAVADRAVGAVRGLFVRGSVQGA